MTDLNQKNFSSQTAVPVQFFELNHDAHVIQSDAEAIQVAKKFGQRICQRSITT